MLLVYAAYNMLYVTYILFLIKNVMMDGSFKELVTIHYALNTLVMEDGSKGKQLVHWSFLRSPFLKTNRRTPICTIITGRKKGLVDGSMAQIDTRKVVGSIQRETL